jgi:hypothetical protein
MTLDQDGAASLARGSNAPRNQIFEVAVFRLRQIVLPLPEQSDPEVDTGS